MPRGARHAQAMSPSRESSPDVAMIDDYYTLVAVERRPLFGRQLLDLVPRRPEKFPTTELRLHRLLFPDPGLGSFEPLIPPNLNRDRSRSLSYRGSRTRRAERPNIPYRPTA